MLDRLHYEAKSRELGYSRVFGIDEVGLGPIAGPVVVCCVELLDMPQSIVLRLGDSKQLSPSVRARLVPEILAYANIGIGVADHAFINQYGLRGAAEKAMLEAFYHCTEGECSKQFKILLDGNVNYFENEEVGCEPIVKGDQKSASIMAASIVAKETRDAYMRLIHELYPQYNFAANAGYGTAQHLEALVKHGPCPIHRRSALGASKKQQRKLGAL